VEGVGLEEAKQREQSKKQGGEGENELETRWGSGVAQRGRGGEKNSKPEGSKTRPSLSFGGGGTKMAGVGGDGWGVPRPRSGGARLWYNRQEQLPRKKKDPDQGKKKKSSMRGGIDRKKKSCN